MPIRTTLDHVTIVADDFQASRPVYDAVLGSLGLVPRLDFGDPDGDIPDGDNPDGDNPDGDGHEGDDRERATVAAIGYSTVQGELRVLLVSGLPPTRGAHFAIAVDEKAIVARAAAAASAAGGRVVQGPREWEAQQLGYYGAQLADIAGNVIEVFYRAGLTTD
ncbi:VOC family protein [Jatrophihabitans sp. DSM 45814]